MSDVTVAVIGRSLPPWLGNLPPGAAATAELISPDRYATVEAGLNDVLARSRVPFLLPVQSGDQIDPAGVASLVAALRQNPAAIGAVGPAEQVRRHGGLRHTPAITPAAAADLLGQPRLSTPVLFRVDALRAVGGWRPGEAAWTHRARRHRRLLARLMAQGYLAAGDQPLGVIAPADPYAPPVPPPPLTDLRDVLTRLLYHTVAVTGAAGQLAVRGQIAGLSGDLVTLAQDGGGLMLIRLDQISTVSPLTGGNAADPPPSWPLVRIRPHTGSLTSS